MGTVNGSPHTRMVRLVAVAVLLAVGLAVAQEGGLDERKGKCKAVPLSAAQKNKLKKFTAKPSAGGIIQGKTVPSASLGVNSADSLCTNGVKRRKVSRVVPVFLSLNSPVLP